MLPACDANHSDDKNQECTFNQLQVHVSFELIFWIPYFGILIL